MNEHVEIKIFASSTKYRGIDQQDERQIAHIMRQDVFAEINCRVLSDQSEG